MNNKQHNQRLTRQAPSKQELAAATQRDERERGRAESVLDKSIPLGLPTAPSRVELGMPASEYYRRRHAPGGQGAGRYYPLHMVAKFRAA